MTQVNDTHPAQPSELALRLGYAGLLPFVFGAMVIWLLAGRNEPEPLAFAAQALSNYAAMIATFLGGMRWGLVMWTSRAGSLTPAYQRRALWQGLLFGLSAWVGALMPVRAAIVAMGVLIIACYLADRRAYAELGISGWLTLRFRLTVFASLSCFLAAAQL